MEERKEGRQRGERRKEGGWKEERKGGRGEKEGRGEGRKARREEKKKGHASMYLYMYIMHVP